MPHGNFSGPRSSRQVQARSPVPGFAHAYGGPFSPRWEMADAPSEEEELDAQRRRFGAMEEDKQAQDACAAAVAAFEASEEERKLMATRLEEQAKLSASLFAQYGCNEGEA